MRSFELFEGLISQKCQIFNLYDDKNEKNCQNLLFIVKVTILQCQKGKSSILTVKNFQSESKSSSCMSICF